MRLSEAIKNVAEAWGSGLIEYGITKLTIEIDVIDGKIKYKYRWTT